MTSRGTSAAASGTHRGRKPLTKTQKILNALARRPSAVTPLAKRLGLPRNVVAGRVTELCERGRVAVVDYETTNQNKTRAIYSNA